MNRLTIAVLTGFAAASLAVPAMADPRHDGPRAKPNHAYQQGYKAAQRDDRRDRVDQRKAYQQGYKAGQRDDRRYDARRHPGYDARYNGRPHNQNVRYNNGNNYWWGQNGRINCRRPDGTAGTVVGALAGGTLGNLIAGHGDKTVGTLIGGTLGAVLGNEIGRGSASCR